MESILAAIATLPHWVAALFSCSIFATGCALPAPHIASPLIPETPTTATIEIATPTSPREPVTPREPLRPLVPDTGDMQISTGTSHTVSSSLSSHTSTAHGNTTITTSVNGNTETRTLPAATGVSNTIISITENGKTSSYATSTSFNEAEAAEVQAHIEARAAEIHRTITESITEMLSTIPRLAP